MRGGRSQCAHEAPPARAEGAHRCRRFPRRPDLGKVGKTDVAEAEPELAPRGARPGWRPPLRGRRAPRDCGCFSICALVAASPGAMVDRPQR